MSLLVHSIQYHDEIPPKGIHKAFVISLMFELISKLFLLLSITSLYKYKESNPFDC